MSNVCEVLFTDKNFNYYNSKTQGNFPKISTLIAEDLFEKWWSDEKFHESRLVFESSARDKEGPLKYEICKYFESKNFDIIKDVEEEYKLFTSINIEGIITTNWDNLLEKTFPDFEVYVGQKELIFNNSIDLGIIYKIHGCITKPNSLVVTENDYNNFNSKNPYLASKLLTIFMEHPIIFIGYSINDPNIIEILKSIIGILDNENIEKLKNQLIFCERRKDNIEETTFLDGNLLIESTNLPIKKIQYHSLIDLLKILKNNNRKLPIKVLRKMKEMVFEFVKTSKPKNKVYVLADEDNLDELISKGQFVYGFGLKEKLSLVGIKGLNINDLFNDLLQSNSEFDPEAIVYELIPSLPGKFFPRFKYLRQANLLDEKGEISHNEYKRKINIKFVTETNNVKIDNFHPVKNYKNKEVEINKKYSSLGELINSEDSKHILLYIPLLNISKFTTDELYTYIQSLNLKKGEDFKPTHIRKLLCFYDFLKYKIQHP